MDITGAGILIIEKSTNIILFHNNLRNTYEEGGGTRDIIKNKPENIKKTASREMKEESKNMFDIKILKHKIVKNKYALYLINSKNTIELDVYNYNKRLLDQRNISEYWDETDKVTKINISQLFEDNIMSKYSNFITQDVFGEKIILGYRILSLLHEMIRNKIINKNKVNIPEVELELKVDNDNKFLNSTISYTLH